MQAAVIAAGQGQRLREAGWLLPKPLVPVAGRPLLEYVLRELAEAGARSVAVVLNEHGGAVEAYCRRFWPELAFAFVYRNTPSSMESLFALEPLLQQEFLLATADTLVAPGSVQAFCVAARRHANAAVVLGVTSFVDDEKPLWVSFEDDGRVVALGGHVQARQWVTAGLYYLHRRVFRFVPTARAARLGALRDFLALLLRAGEAMYAVPIGKCIDVDRAEDLRVAAEFLARE